MAVQVKREIHNNSYYEPKRNNRWAIYVNGELSEGGFSSRAAAEQQADQMRNELRAEGVQHLPQSWR